MSSILKVLYMSNNLVDELHLHATNRIIPMQPGVLLSSVVMLRCKCNMLIDKYTCLKKNDQLYLYYDTQV